MVVSFFLLLSQAHVYFLLVPGYQAVNSVANQLPLKVAIRNAVLRIRYVLALFWWFLFRCEKAHFMGKCKQDELARDCVHWRGWWQGQCGNVFSDWFYLLTCIWCDQVLIKSLFVILRFKFLMFSWSVISVESPQSINNNNNYYYYHQFRGSHFRSTCIENKPDRGNGGL